MLMQGDVGQIPPPTGTYPECNLPFYFVLFEVDSSPLTVSSETELRWFAAKLAKQSARTSISSAQRSNVKDGTACSVPRGASLNDVVI